MLYICSDHGGFGLKTQLIKHLVVKNIEFDDVGPSKLNPEDDYPVYVKQTMERMTPDDKAIVMCRNGVGVCVMVNKFRGIRCALSWTPDHARSARVDDNSNVLSLPADYIDVKTALEIVDVWLTTPFSNEERHIRRLEEVASVEK